MNGVLPRFMSRGFFFFLKTEKRKVDGRETECSVQGLWSVRSWGFLQWHCSGLPGDLILGLAAWEEHEPVDTLKMGLNPEIPFAPFLFGSPRPSLSPPFCLSILSNNMGMETANVINEENTHHGVSPNEGERVIVKGCGVFVMYSEGWK